MHRSINVCIGAPRTVRLIWLAALLLRDDQACLTEYRRRFGLSLHAVRRDVKAVRRVGSYFEEYLAIQCGMLIYLWLTDLM
jgi:hypothetical protein